MVVGECQTQCVGRLGWGGSWEVSLRGSWLHTKGLWFCYFLRSGVFHCDLLEVTHLCGLWLPLLATLWSPLVVMGRRKWLPQVGQSSGRG